MSKTKLSVIREQFPTFELFTQEELTSASPTELQKIFSDLSDLESQINNKVITQQAELGHKEEQFAELISKVKSETGVSTVEELEKLRDIEIGKFNKLVVEFGAFLNSEVEEENGE